MALARVLSNLVEERTLFSDGGVGIGLMVVVLILLRIVALSDLMIGVGVLLLHRVVMAVVCLRVAKTLSLVCPLHGRQLSVSCWKTQLTTDRVTWTLVLLARLVGLNPTPMNPEIQVLSGMLHRSVTETVTEKVLTILVRAEFRPLSPRKILLRLLLGHELVATQFLVLVMSNDAACDGCDPGRCPWIGWHLTIVVGLLVDPVPVLDSGRLIP